MACIGAAAACTREAAPARAVEPPDVGAPAPSPAVLSRFSVPLEYDFSAVLGLVEKNVPTRFGSIDSVRQIGTDSRKHYAFEAVRGPFTAFADGNLLHLRATLEYKARGYYKPVIGPTIAAGCGNDAERPRIVVELATPLSLSSTYHLVSHARIVSVQPASTLPRDRCDVSILHHDVTDRVVEAARGGLEGQLANIDKKVGEVDLTSHVTEWWGLLSRPIKLADRVWLLLGPERLRAGKVRGRSKILTVPVSLDARPRIVTSETEPSDPTLPLPVLARDSASDGFHVVLDALVDYATASRAMNMAAGRKSIVQAGHTIILKSIAVLPDTGGRLAVSVSFGGDATGMLKLVGTPRYDRLHDLVTVPDLDFDVQSNSKLIQTYAWLKSDALRTELRKKARVPAAPALDRGRALLLEGLNRKIGDAVTLSATVDSIGVRGLFVTRDGLLLRGEATGRAGVSVQQR
ncbi:MAG: DUF4403 family protein [bacterium]